MRTYNIANGWDIGRFLNAIVSLACWDHAIGRRKGRSGDELVNMYCTDWRKMHCRLATTVYNQTRRTLEVTAKEAETND